MYMKCVFPFQKGSLHSEEGSNACDTFDVKYEEPAELGRLSVEQVFAAALLPGMYSRMKVKEALAGIMHDVSIRQRLDFDISY